MGRRSLAEVSHAQPVNEAPSNGNSVCAGFINDDSPGVRHAICNPLALALLLQESRSIFLPDKITA